MSATELYCEVATKALDAQMQQEARSLRHLVQLKIITQEEAVQFLRNAEYFQTQRAHLELLHPNTWAATVDGHLYLAESVAGLYTAFEGQSGENYAHIEHIGGL